MKHARSVLACRGRRLEIGGGYLLWSWSNTVGVCGLIVVVPVVKSEDVGYLIVC